MVLRRGPVPFQGDQMLLGGTGGDVIAQAGLVACQQGKTGNIIGAAEDRRAQLGHQIHKVSISRNWHRGRGRSFSLFLSWAIVVGRLRLCQTFGQWQIRIIRCAEPKVSAHRRQQASAYQHSRHPCGRRAAPAGHRSTIAICVQKPARHFGFDPRRLIARNHPTRQITAHLGQLIAVDPQTGVIVRHRHAAHRPRDQPEHRYRDAKRRRPKPPYSHSPPQPIAALDVGVLTPAQKAHFRPRHNRDILTPRCRNFPDCAAGVGG